MQVARLQREMEGLEEQRTRAREEARRAEHARQQLEMEIKVLALVLPAIGAALMHQGVLRVATDDQQHAQNHPFASFLAVV